MNHAELIEAMGGTGRVATLCGVAGASVTKWKTAGIPEGRLIRLAVIAEMEGITTRRKLFPDCWRNIWPELAVKRAKR
jgi:hypothetical protein